MEGIVRQEAVLTAPSLQLLKLPKAGHSRPGPGPGQGPGRRPSARACARPLAPSGPREQPRTPAGA